MNPPDTLTPQQLSAILQFAGILQPGQAMLLKKGNHIWRIKAAGDVFFLKIYTKTWYGNDIADTGFCVEHEVAAWNVLRIHGIATPSVATESRTCDNPLDRPFLMTHQLRGTSLTPLLKVYETDPTQFAELLEASGAFLRQVHAITFEQSGYITDRGPEMSADPDAWQHWLWSARATQRDALRILEEDKARLSPELYRELAVRLTTLEQALASAWQPPCFTHGDCQTEQFFLYHEAERWHVSGFVDMEVALAGDCTGDLIKFAIEMMVSFPPTTRWWEPFFAGYGGEPDFELFRLRLLGWHQANFTAHGADLWPATREQTQRRFLAARSWAELFRA